MARPHPLFRFLSAGNRPCQKRKKCPRQVYFDGRYNNGFAEAIPSVFVNEKTSQLIIKKQAT